MVVVEDIVAEGSRVASVAWAEAVASAVAAEDSAASVAAEAVSVVEEPQAAGKRISMKKFTEQDLARIKAAVKEAESATAGEIVPYFVQTSDEYEDVILRSVVMFIAAPLLMFAILSFGWLLPFHVTPLTVAIFCLVSGIIGYVLPLVWPGFRRLLLTRSRLQNAVERRAMAAFLSEEIFATENRTGILIFVSYFEHVVEVMGDSGINEKVNQEDWNQVVELIVEGIKQKDPVGGLEHGIKKCGELLVAAGIEKPPGNPNELSDDIRIS